MLQSYIGNDINEEQMMDVLGNVSLEPTSKEKASYITDYDKSILVKQRNLKKLK